MNEPRAMHAITFKHDETEFWVQLDSRGRLQWVDFEESHGSGYMEVVNQICLD